MIMNRHVSDETTVKLLDAAKAAREAAYAPYSDFPVGAAVLFADGEIISGCNVENSSYGLSICAERNAMSSAVTRGYNNPIAIAIAGGRGMPCPPCGACRQFLAEFNENMDVIIEDINGFVVYKLSELLPLHFNLQSGREKK